MVLKMSSGLVAPPGGGEEICAFLLRLEGENGVRRREVGCQWESPQQETREVGCQSDSAPRRDAGVQVDLKRHLGEVSLSLQVDECNYIFMFCFMSPVFYCEKSGGSDEEGADPSPSVLRCVRVDAVLT